MSDFDTLVKLVQEARKEDEETFAVMKQAEIAWKAANKKLTDRIEVLNSYVQQKTKEEI